MLSNAYKQACCTKEWMQVGMAVGLEEEALIFMYGQGAYGAAEGEVYPDICGGAYLELFPLVTQCGPIPLSSGLSKLVSTRADAAMDGRRASLGRVSSVSDRHM